ncbi:phosphatase PAP2 family protein [Olsenella sp. DSM 107455]|uniref:Phosphatase PAP2 family protein n=1 Tax=Thermophilibacter gallinarum TaxID=2779357 RepID=A0ABR9QQL3_9ACTN|nr:phosphatase PAP2 family protein [Thermophilibacter gallinarum]MBE5023347.1 phosphatase PAP2 family protein [Thermophilibacter gallinarum]
MGRREELARGARETTRGALGLFRDNRRVVVLLAAALIFVWLLGEVASGEIMRLDTLAYQVFVETLRSDALTPFMEAFTSLASVVVLAVMAAVIAALAPGKAPGWCVAVNLVCVVVLNTVLKVIVQRPRPAGFRLISESGYSFPSGHSMVAMAFFGLLIWMVWRYHRRDVMRVVWCVCFGLVIAMVGISRIYLGVHYASDVLAGFCVSLIWLIFYTRVIAPAFVAVDAPRDPDAIS